MSTQNALNVYSGEDSLKKYFDPDYAPLLPLVEIPDSLNPFRGDGVRIYAKMMTMLPAHNVKSLPAMNLLSKSVDPQKTKTIVEYSSGSTVISMSMIARIFHGIGDCRAYLSNKTSDSKLKLMQFFGLNITLFAGPSQPDPYDPRGGIQVAHTQSQEDERICNPNQYENDANWSSHYRWTGPQILKQLPDLNVLCTGVGTSGTMTGIGTYLGEHKPSVARVGVFTAAGDRVPGPRSFALIAPVKFPWRDAIDAIEEVGSSDSFRLSMELSREGLICGPSSGFNLQGLCQFLEKKKAAGTLHDLTRPGDEVKCVFLCCDLPYQYMGEYFDKLDSACFPPITNAHLKEIDLYNNYLNLEEEPETVMPKFYDLTASSAAALTLPWTLRDGHAIIDLRTTAEFTISHLPGAVNLPISSLGTDTPSPFTDAQLFATQWQELEALFGGGSMKSASPLAKELSKKEKVLLVCNDGDTARIAASILKGKGASAESIRGGIRAIDRWMLEEFGRRTAVGTKDVMTCKEGPILGVKEISVG